MFDKLWGLREALGLHSPGKTDLVAEIKQTDLKSLDSFAWNVGKSSRRTSLTYDKGPS